MLSENGSIKTADIPVENALVLYRKKLKIISLLMLIAGTAGLVAYIVLSLFFQSRWLDVMYVFAVPFALGLIGTVTMARIHRREQMEQKTSECEFFADCFFCKEKTAPTFQPSSRTDKIAYSDAVLKRENQNYGYIYVFSKGIFIPFGKEDLTAAELNAIRKNFRKPISDVEDISKLEKYKENNS